MQVLTSEIMGESLYTLDGESGKIADILLDDHEWVVRYVVIETGAWLKKRRVLLAPQAFNHPELKEGGMSVSLTREQIEKSPPLNTHEPVSREQERVLHDHYDWAPYWPTYTGESTGLRIEQEQAQQVMEEYTEEHEENHLRSVDELTGYTLRAKDGELGRCEGFLIDLEDWRVKGAAVDTRKWLPGRKVQLPRDWISGVEWSSKDVVLKVSQEDVRNAPELPS